jgi:hypothetical protein
MRADHFRYVPVRNLLSLSCGERDTLECKKNWLITREVPTPAGRKEVFASFMSVELAGEEATTAHSTSPSTLRFWEGASRADRKLTTYSAADLSKRPLVSVPNSPSSDQFGLETRTRYPFTI